MKNVYFVEDLKIEIERLFQDQLHRQNGCQSTELRRGQAWDVIAKGNYAKNLLENLRKIRNNQALLRNTKASIKFIPIFELPKSHSLYNFTKIDLSDAKLSTSIIDGKDESFPEIFQHIENRVQKLLKIVIKR